MKYVIFELREKVIFYNKFETVHENGATVF